MFTVEKIYQFAREKPDWPAVIADLVPVSYLAFARRIAALRRLFHARDLAPGGVAVSLIDDIFASWCVNLAFRSLGHRTLSVRTDAELAGLGELQVAALVRLAGEQWS